MGKAGKALGQVLEKYGISQTKLADALGIGRSNVYRWIKEVRDPNSETVVRIVHILEEVNPEAAKEFKKLYMGD
jgi:transcriptional regulator with XRE-family HTH domain